MAWKVIDVSGHQKTIDWAKVKAAGYWGAIIKAGGSDDGFYKDSKFEYNYKNAKAAGLHVGSYYYVGPKCKSRADGEADAKRFLAFLKGKQFDLPVYIDFEEPDTSNKQGNTNACIGFCEVMENAGYFAGIYASALSGFRDRLYESQLKAYSLWKAWWSHGSVPSGCAMWQYLVASPGAVPGISTRIDLDYCYEDFPTTIISGGFNGYPKQSGNAAHEIPAETVSKSDYDSVKAQLAASESKARELADKNTKALALLRQVQGLIDAFMKG